MSNDVSDDAIANLKNKNKKNDNVDTNNDEPIEEKHDDIAKPEKRNIFQRVQNKALDANVQFKKKVAEAKRKSVDAKNAGKAVSKIPENVTSSIKSQINEWDTMDDNKRKEYILKPGVRKKYFRALKLCIYHGALFAINPVLNIVLFIATKLGHSKDERIRNEVLTELESEIKVTEEKIEDARRREDDKQKYQLMRIRDKLQAEVVRVSSNSKVI